MANRIFRYNDATTRKLCIWNYLESKLTHETNLSILDLELSRWLSALWVTSMDLIVKKKSPIVAPNTSSTPLRTPKLLLLLPDYAKQILNCGAVKKLLKAYQILASEDWGNRWIKMSLPEIHYCSWGGVVG
uniref:Uncharacterized protein n=1 Tax=Rhizophagus irregularis (strain DAOM 181602 / DAOM 197198 / MUCL 43194) TaxID=747089 RepID=U9TR30_RHIID